MKGGVYKYPYYYLSSLPHLTALSVHFLTKLSLYSSMFLWALPGEISKIMAEMRT